jgi:hypothetical protein
MDSLIKALVSRKVVRFVIFAVLGAVAVTGILVIGFIYFLWGSYFYYTVRYKADEPKLQAKMERVTDRVIPSHYFLQIKVLIKALV